jgi:nucleotidyltransferase/DNA polymerase involved in DNA repair
MADKRLIQKLTIIPGVGKSIARDLWDIGIRNISDLAGQDPEILYDMSNKFTGKVQDRCLLYTFRCAVYYANTPEHEHDPQKLKWWNWKELNFNKNPSIDIITD